MIVKMKKVIVLVQSKDVSSTLNVLGKVGLLHIEHENAPLSEDVRVLEEKIGFHLKAIEALPDTESTRGQPLKPEDIVSAALGLIDEKEVILENLKKIRKDIGLWEEWGDFDPGLIDDLKTRGVFVRICKLTKKEMWDMPREVILEELFRKSNIFYCALISRKDVPVPFETLALPEKGLQKMFEELDKEEKRVRQIDKRLHELAEHKSLLFSYKRQLESLLELNRALAGMGKFEKVSYLKGYCPVYSVSVLEKLAARERWGLIIEEPGEKDNVPTLIKNPAWVDIIKPVFQIINVIPGYCEVDISPYFLIFFSLFFGMLIGDAGYGLVYIFLTMFMQRKMKHLKNKNIFLLAYSLSSCAVIWGLITGIFFGPHKWINPLIPYFSKNVNTQSFCFLIGATQLSIAHIWKFLRKWPSLKALGDIGWVFILWAAYFLANTLILNKAFPVFGKHLFIAGTVLVILFTNPARNVLKGIGVGLGEFLLKVMGSFGDIVSYIRLFAVGAAGVAIAGAFNQIVAAIGARTLLTSLVCFIVLFLGHTLNMVMGILAILVHGVRLNVLEFSSHLDMEWSGTEYSPFRAEN